MEWVYKGDIVKDVAQFGDCVIGFVYKITDLETNKFYIGRKVLFFERTQKISKREKKATKTRKSKKIVRKESDWKTYYGSCTELLADVKKYGEIRFQREILELCCDKKYLGYCEVKWQIIHNVLNTNSYNENILGKFFRKDLKNCD